MDGGDAGNAGVDVQLTGGLAVAVDAGEVDQVGACGVALGGKVIVEDGGAGVATAFDAIGACVADVPRSLPDP